MPINTVLKRYDGNTWEPIYMKTSANMVEYKGASVEYWLSSMQQQMLSLFGDATDILELPIIADLPSPNLLDNAIFDGDYYGPAYGSIADTFPINQMESSVVTSGQYICDRWIYSGDDRCTLESSGITIQRGSWQLSQKFPEGALYQRLQQRLNITLTVYGSSGLLTKNVNLEFPTTTIAFSNGTIFEIHAPSDGQNYVVYSGTGYAHIYAIKLETRSSQSLAVQSFITGGGVMLLYQPGADFVTQTLRCQRYYWQDGIKSGSFNTCSGQIMNGGRDFAFSISVPTKMIGPLRFSFASFGVYDAQGNQYLFSSDNMTISDIRSLTSLVTMRFQVPDSTGLVDGVALFTGRGWVIETDL